MTLFKIGKAMEFGAMVIFCLCYLLSILLVVTSLFYMTDYDWWLYVAWIMLVMMMWLLLIFPVKFKDEDWS